MALVSINPATGRVLHRYRPHTQRELESRLAAAARAAEGWRELVPAARARHLRALAGALHADRAALAEIVSAEMGKPVADALAEVAKCVECCRHYARHGAAYLRPEKPLGAPAGVEVVYEPVGVVLAIMPWNFPLWQAIRAAVPAWVAGNTILLKHAGNVTGTALALVEVARKAGLPTGVFDCLLVSGAAVEPLIADPRVAGVTFTGSTAAGRRVAALAGASLKPCVLELGGSDPYLVFPDADLDQAAVACAAARLVNNGQSCVAAKRIIVHAAVAAAFITRFAAALAAIAPTLGPLAREDLRDELHSQVARSVRRGARLVLGGKRPGGPGAFYPVTLLTHVAPGMPACDEELFGPVAVVQIVPDEAAALAAANSTPYGLGAAIFTGDRARGRELAVERLRAGMVFVNHGVRSHVAVPFGGTKSSGLGRELGLAGVRAFTNAKTVWVA
jgi:succinate-semialdehyde dehydrogenase / glutarate-semialdehyde dehydrogenase